MHAGTFFFRAKASLIVINKGYCAFIFLAVRGKQPFMVVKNGATHRFCNRIDKRFADVKKNSCGNLDYSCNRWDFDYQGWQVFIIVKITLQASHNQHLAKIILS
jgi:hypothetical protein